MSVYKIDLGNNNIYVGSTKNPLSMRKCGHIHSFTTGKNKKLYNFMREHGINEFNLDLLETVNDGTLKIREEHYRKTLNANLNSIRCYITEDERLHQKNKTITCTCGAVVRIDNINRHKKSNKHKNTLSI